MIKVKEGITFELINWEGEMAIMFNDGDIFLQSDTIATFLMHVSILMPNCELPDKLEIKKVARQFHRQEFQLE